MDEVEELLRDILAVTDEAYRDIAETAIEGYARTGTLTEKQHAWAAKRARIHKIKVPPSFADLEQRPSPSTTAGVTPAGGCQIIPLRAASTNSSAAPADVLGGMLEEIAKALAAGAKALRDRGA